MDHSYGPTDKNSVIPRDKTLVRLNKCDREYIQNGTSLIYIINEVHQLFLARKCRGTHIASAAGGSLQVISFVFSSLRRYFLPSDPTVIDQAGTLYDPSCLSHRLRSVDTRRDAATRRLLLLNYKSVYLCSQTELLMGKMIVEWRGRGSNREEECHCLICAGP